MRAAQLRMVMIVTIFMLMSLFTTTAFAQDDVMVLDMPQNRVDRLENLRTGNVYTLAVDMPQIVSLQIFDLSPDFQPIFRVYNEAGLLLPVIVRPAERNSAETTVSLPAAGTYRIVIQNINNRAGDYMLSVRALRMLPDDMMNVTENTMMMRQFDEGLDVERYQFEAVSDAGRALMVSGASMEDGVQLSLLNLTNGREVAAMSLPVSSGIFCIAPGQDNYAVDIMREDGRPAPEYMVLLVDDPEMVCSESTADMLLEMASNIEILDATGDAADIINGVGTDATETVNDIATDAVDTAADALETDAVTTTLVDSANDASVATDDTSENSFPDSRSEEILQANNSPEAQEAGAQLNNQAASDSTMDENLLDAVLANSRFSRSQSALDAGILLTLINDLSDTSFDMGQVLSVPDMNLDAMPLETLLMLVVNAVNTSVGEFVLDADTLLAALDRAAGMDVIFAEDAGRDLLQRVADAVNQAGGEVLVTPDTLLELIVDESDVELTAADIGLLTIELPGLNGITDTDLLQLLVDAVNDIAGSDVLDASGLLIAIDDSGILVDAFGIEALVDTAEANAAGQDLLQRVADAMNLAGGEVLVTPDTLLELIVDESSVELTVADMGLLAIDLSDLNSVSDSDLLQLLVDTVNNVADSEVLDASGLLIAIDDSGILVDAFGIEALVDTAEANAAGQDLLQRVADAVNQAGGEVLVTPDTLLELIVDESGVELTVADMGLLALELPGLNGMSDGDLLTMLLNTVNDVAGDDVLNATNLLNRVDETGGLLVALDIPEALLVSAGAGNAVCDATPGSRVSRFNVRSLPGGIADIEATLNVADDLGELPVLGQALNGTWIQIDLLDGRTGYVAASVLDLTACANLDIPIIDLDPELVLSVQAPLPVVDTNAMSDTTVTTDGVTSTTSVTVDNVADVNADVSVNPDGVNVVVDVDAPIDADVNVTVDGDGVDVNVGDTNVNVDAPVDVPVDVPPVEVPPVEVPPVEVPPVVPTVELPGVGG